jgi:hypothetical protein
MGVRELGSGATASPLAINGPILKDSRPCRAVAISGRGVWHSTGILGRHRFTGSRRDVRGKTKGEIEVEQRRYTESAHTEAPAEENVARPAAATGSAPNPPPGLVLVRIIHILEAVLLVLLAFRFVFALLGADAANAFVNFIYTVSWPFVYPFVGIFGYTSASAVAAVHVELYTLVAMAVWALVAWVLVKVVSIRRV